MVPAVNKLQRNEHGDPNSIQQSALTMTASNSILLEHQCRYLFSVTKSGTRSVNSKVRVPTCCREHFFRRAEPIRFRHTDGKPDKAQQKIYEI